MTAGHPGRPTMRDVAALSRTSIKTVSRVVNREAGVSSDLVERVLQAARALNYQPNLTASSLRRADRKTRTIGLLLENVANPFSSQLHRAIESVARKRDVLVFAGSLDQDPARERELATALVSRQVDGLITMPTNGDHSYLAEVRRAGTPLVFVDRRPRFLDADSVVTDNQSGARCAVAHLLRHGHREIGYLGDLLTIETASARFAGYSEALAEVGTKVRSELVRHDLRTADEATQAAVELLAMPTPPTALFASQNLVTIGVLRALKELGRRHDVALVGFDEVPLAELIEPGITVFVQDVAGLGETAAELLFRRLDGEVGPTQNLVLPGRLLMAGSGEIPGPYPPVG